MFKLRHNSICHGQVGGECTAFSIWNWNANMEGPLYEFANKFSFCRKEMFPLLYWMTISLAIIGLLNSVWEFAKMYHGCEVLSTFRKRRYRILPFSIRRNTRLFASVFSMKAWVLLLVGIITVNPLLISFWLTLNVSILGIDFFVWVLEVLTNEVELLFTTVLSFVCYLGTVLLVRCVRNVFQVAVEEHDTEHLQLLRLLD